MKRLHRSKLLKRLRASLAALVATLASSALAAPFALDLTGTTSVDGWANLNGTNFPGLSFPGSGAWPTTGNWTSYNGLGAIGSNTAGSGDALLYKVSNGSGGGPYPAGGSIYFGGFSGDANVNGGTLGVVDTTPLTGLKTVAFQVDIGEASGYDFYNGVLPTLTYTTVAGGSTVYSLGASNSELLLQIYTGDILMPTGYEDIYRNTWGLQFDLSGITDEITSFQLSFTGVQHAQLYALQLDQSNAKYTTSVFATDATWDGGAGNSLWSGAANWSNDSLPTSGKGVLFNTGNSVVLDGNQTVQGLTLATSGNFALTSQGGAVLTVGDAGITATSTGPATYSIAAPVVFTGLHIVNVGANTNLALTGSLTAPGFYKSGEGHLELAGNNTYSGNAMGRLIVNGGSVSLTGTNTYTGTDVLELEVKSGTVTLHGGDNRLSSNFTVDLVSRRIVNGGDTMLNEAGHLVLGNASGKSDLTLAGLKADGTNTFNQVSALTTTETASNASVTGDSAQVSTLTLNVASGQYFTYLGNLGGAGTNDNNLALVKKGAGVQTIGGTSTYTGDTVVEEGVLKIGSATALSTASHLTLKGGVLGLGGGDFTLALGTGANQVSLQGNTGFAAYGAVRKVNLGGSGATVTWGSGGFLRDGDRLVLAAPTGDTMAEITSPTSTVEMVNPIALGSQTRTIQVQNGSATVDARLIGALSGTGGLEKTGAGTLETTAANTYTGGTVVKEGFLALAGTAGSVKGNVEVHAGATLQLTNTVDAANGNRVEDNATVTLKGATLNFNNATAGTTPAFSETVGTLALDRGANIVTTSRAADGNTAILTVGSITRQGGATVNFNGASVGLDARNQVRYTSAPTLDDGILGGWATVGNEFATYGLYGVTALTTYEPATPGTWTAASNVKISGIGVTTTLSAATQVNSLNLVGPTTGSVANTVNLNGQTLRVESGGILASGGTSTRKNIITGGNLTAGTGANTDAELIVTANGVLDITATITDNGTGSVSLVKAGSNALTLTQNNTYSGDTIVNQGTLNITGTQTGGNDLIVRKGANLYVTGSIAVSGSLQLDGFAWGAGNINFGAGSVLTGSGGTEFAVNVGMGAGKVAVLSPGNSPGTLQTMGQTWSAGGTFLWEVSATNLSGSNIGQGTTYDYMNILGTLDLTSLTAGAFDIDITSLTSSNANGLLAGFDLYDDYAWTILTASGGITGFEASDFNLDTSGFANSFTGGSFSLGQSGNSLVLSYTGAVPEPGRALLLLFGLCSAILRRRR